MSNALKATSKAVQDCLTFIRAYRKLESLTYKESAERLEEIFHKLHPSKISHIMDHWRYKKQDFGDFFLNLDSYVRIDIYNSFGIFDRQDEQYLEKINKDKMAALFLEPPPTYQNIKKTIMFFFNHGISTKPAEFLSLTSIPKSTGRSFSDKNPCYGNSKNWGKYILSLVQEEQERVIGSILENYSLQF